MLLLEKFAAKEVPLDKLFSRKGACVPGGRRAVAKSIIQDLVRGVTPPVVVRPSGNGYEIIAGDLVVEAARERGDRAITALVGDVRNVDALVFRLIEGVARGEVNPVEEAEMMLELNRDHGLTQHEIAVRCGRVQSTVANKIRLLRLPAPILDALRRGEIGERHARALLELDDPGKQMEVFRRCLNQHLSASEVESICSLGANRKGKPRGRGRRAKSVVKDARIFQNALRSVVREMQKAGLDAKCEEQTTEGSWEFRVSVRILRG